MAGTGTSGSYGTVSVGAAAVLVVAARFSRNGLVVQNVHATQTLYLGNDSSVTTSTGIQVPAGASADFPDYAGAVWGIASGAATDTRFFEVY